MDDAEVKKECPSCGLGVALDARICEFCGWDFNEEDEWILQIEKLERDLALEKQKFEPGSVASKIESSLRIPAVVKKEQLKTSAAKAKLQQQMAEILGAPEEPKPRAETAPPTPPRTSRAVREASLEEVQVTEVRKEPPEHEQLESEPELIPVNPASPPSGKVRRVRKVKGAQASEAPTVSVQPSRPKIIKKAKE